MAKLEFLSVHNEHQVSPGFYTLYICESACQHSYLSAYAFIFKCLNIYTDTRSKIRQGFKCVHHQHTRIDACVCVRARTRDYT